LALLGLQRVEPRAGDMVQTLRTPA